jgi:hypothetical protein
VLETVTAAAPWAVGTSTLDSATANKNDSEAPVSHDFSFGRSMTVGSSASSIR